MDQDDSSTVVSSNGDRPEPGGDLATGSIIDARFEIISRLGQGGMGTVYLGKQIAMERPVAIKVLLSSLLSGADSEQVRRFHMEAKALALLKHPGIISCHAFGISDGLPFIVMEYLEGKSLSEVLKESGQLETGRALNITLQIADALSYAHKNGVIHRDIKPSNIMLCSAESMYDEADNKDARADRTLDLVRVLDFGIAKLIPESGAQIQRLTKTGQLLGTLSYISPEQCSNKSVDQRSDIYSLGAVLYELLSGKPPFRGDNLLDTLNKILNEDPPPINRKLPANLTAVLMRSLAKDPDERYQNMEQFAADLQSIQANKSTTTLLSWPKRKAANAKTTSLTLATIALLLFLGAGATQMFVLDDAKAAAFWKNSASSMAIEQLNQIAALYHKIGRNRTAAFICRYVLEQEIKSAPTDHATIIDLAKRLADVYDALLSDKDNFDNVQTSEQLSKQSLQILKGIFWNKADDSFKKKKYAKAISEYRLALAMTGKWKDRGGQDYVSLSMNPAANPEHLPNDMETDLGKISLSRAIMQQAASGKERSLLLRTAALHYDLGMALAISGKSTEAADEFVISSKSLNDQQYPIPHNLYETKMLKMLKFLQISGANQMQQDMVSIMQVLISNNKSTSEAEKLLSCQIELEKIRCGPESIEVAKRQRELAAVYERQKNWEKARDLHLESLRIYEKRTGDKRSPELINQLCYLCSHYANTNKTLAAAFEKRIFEIRIGEDDSADAKIAEWFELREIYFKNSKIYNEAEYCSKRALQIEKTRLRRDQLRIAERLLDLGQIYNCEKDYKKAEPILQEALASFLKQPNLAPKAVIMANSDLISTFLMEHKYLEAEQAITSLLSIGTPEAKANALYNLALVRHFQKREVESISLMERAIKAFEQFEGPQSKTAQNLQAQMLKKI